MPVSLCEDDPCRRETEAALRRLNASELRDLYWETRAAARIARQKNDMATLFSLVRGTKTLQRIANEKGIVIRVDPVTP